MTKQAISLHFLTNTCSVHSPTCPWPNHRSLKMPKPHELLMDNLTLLTFQFFPSLAKFWVHGKFLCAVTTACHIYAPVRWQRVCAKIQTPQIKRQSFNFSKSNSHRARTHRPNQTATHPAKLIAWNQTQTNWGTWGTHANRSRLSSLSCDPIQQAITLQIRSYSRGIVLCQHTPSPSIPPVPSQQPLAITNPRAATPLAWSV